MTVYQNKFLKLDLSKREAVETPLDPDVVRDFLGGRGFGIEYLYKHLPPHTDPLSPDNILLFLPGILGGTSAPGFSRWIVAARSPLTGAYIRSVCGGKFGAAIKTCGYEFIAIHGRADRPTYVHLSKEGAEFLDADVLSGKDLTQIDLLGTDTDSPALGDGDGALVKRVFHLG